MLETKMKWTLAAMAIALLSAAVLAQGSLAGGSSEPMHAAAVAK